MSAGITKIQTLEEEIEATIFRNLELSDGKERSYFDIMRNVVPDFTKLGNKILSRLCEQGAVKIKRTTTFLNGRPHVVEMYQCNLPKLRELAS
jgi:hypothetical protein